MKKKLLVIAAFIFTLLLGILIGIKLYDKNDYKNKEITVIEKNSFSDKNINEEKPLPPLPEKAPVKESISEEKETAKHSEIKEIINETLLSKSGKLAILIDDTGSSISLAKEFIELKIPLSFAILPYLSKSKEVNSLLRNDGYRTILHLPMEGSDKAVNEKTKNLLRINLSNNEMEEIFSQALENVGPVSGFNNHMGSEFTSSKEAMRTILEFAKRENLFFIDSKTTAKSKGINVAKNLNIPSAECVHFLDNSKQVSDIEKEIVRAIAIAQKRGSAIVIGHFHKNMVEALKNSKEILIKSNIKLVFVDEILE